MITSVGNQKRTGSGLDPISWPRSGYAPVPSLRLLVIVVAAAALANFNYIWNHFYREVPALFDTGWYAHLVYRSGPLLHNPPAVVFATITPSFYGTHFAPLLWVMSWPSYLLPVGPVVWLGCLEAIKYGLLMGMVWLAVRRIMTDASELPTRGVRLAAGTVVALAAFNGVVLASVDYPHFEGWFIVFGLAFLYLLFRGRTRLALIPFGATLLLREDMGFHLCGLLVVTTAGAWCVRRQWDDAMRTWLRLAGIGFAWSALSLVVIKACFPGDNALGRVYLGSPAFAHLTWAAVVDRWHTLYAIRGYLWMPVVVYVAWAVVARSGWMLLGYAAFIPWFLLNFTAKNLAPASLSFYYTFPFALALLWPLVGHLVFTRDSRSFGRGLSWMAVAMILSVVGFVRGNDWVSLGRNFAAPVIDTKVPLEAVASQVLAARERGEAVATDNAFAVHGLREFTPDNLFALTPAKVSLAAFYANGRQIQIGWETSRHLPFLYRVVRTPVVVASAQPLSWPYLDLISSTPGSITPYLRTDFPALRWAQGTAKEGDRLICAGPNWYFRPGETWTATLTLVLDNLTASAGPVVCEIATRDGALVMARTEFTAAELEPGRNLVVRELTFTIPADIKRGLEVRIHASAESAGQVRDVVLRPGEELASAPAPKGMF